MAPARPARLTLLLLLILSAAGAGPLRRCRGGEGVAAAAAAAAAAGPALSVSGGGARRAVGTVQAGELCGADVDCLSGVCVEFFPANNSGTCGAASASPQATA